MLKQSYENENLQTPKIKNPEIANYEGSPIQMNYIQKISYLLDPNDSFFSSPFYQPFDSTLKMNSDNKFINNDNEKCEFEIRNKEIIEKDVLR